MKSEDVSEHYRIVIGRRIFEERERQKMSQEELAERVNVAREYLSRIENGNVLCSMDIYFRIAGALSVTPYVLMMESTTMRQMREWSKIINLSDDYERHVAIEMGRHAVALIREKPDYDQKFM